MARKAKEFKPHTLFNCCTDWAEPNWGEFTGLEVGGCRLEGNGEDQITVGGIAFEEAEFFSVYGRRPDGDREAITDIPKAAHNPLAIIGALARRSGLPVTFYCIGG